jgi:hypothetical protein
MASGDPFRWIMFLLVFCLLIALIVGLYAYISQRRKMKRFVNEHQFQSLGKELPDGLFLQKTSFAWRDLEIADSIRGMLHGVDTVLFVASFEVEDEDSGPIGFKRLGPKVERHSQTVVAFSRQGLLQCDDLSSNDSDSLHFETAGDWLISYEDDLVVSPEELDSWTQRTYERAAALAQAGAGRSSAR